MERVGTHANASKLLRLLLGASIVLPASLFGIGAWVSYRTAFQDSGTDTARSADVAREHAAKVFDTQRLVAERVGDLVDGMDDAAIAGNETVLHQRLLAITADFPQVQSVVVLDAEGHPVLAGDSFPVRHSLDFTDRDYFKALRDGDKPLYLSMLQTNRFTGKPFFGVGIRRRGPDGAFAGVVDVAVSPAFFGDFYATLVGGSSSGASGKVIALIRSDGQFLVRFPPFAGPAPKVSRPNRFFDAIDANAERGTYMNTSVIDAGAPRRTFMYRKVSGYPAYVVAGRSESAVLHEWAMELASGALLGLPVWLALVLVTATAVRRTRREQAAVAQMRDEMQRREVAEEALRQAQKLEAVGRLTGGMAHDFNNILTVVLGTFDLLLRDRANPERVERLTQTGIMAARQGAVLTNKLLAFSRRELTQPETVNANDLIQGFVPVLERAATHTLAIVLDLDPHLAPTTLDVSAFQAALLNLVANARDATPDGGSVTITSRNTAADALMAGPAVRIAVTDTGHGMDPAVAGRAFEPFFTTKEAGKGTGLGLSQVYGFAQQVGGHIRIISAPGGGTTVELLLPAASAAAPAPPAVPEADPDTGKACGTVLVVEDEPAIRDLAAIWLTDAGYTTLSAANGQEALRYLEGAGRIDIMVSDVVMPGMNGVQLTEAARRLRPGLTVLLTSGYTGSADRRGIPDDVKLLAKPYERAALLAWVRALSKFGHRDS
ncbi:MAG: ATP-binding protein [Acetobacteraceae bacterium]